MTNVTKVIRPFFEKYINRSSVESTVLFGPLLNVMPRSGLATTNAAYDNQCNHGWDNTLASIQAIFMARGPLFNANIQIDSINNVNIYHIACRILKLDPNPYATAGSLVNLTSLFRSVENVTTPSTFISNSSTIERFTTSMKNACCLFSTYLFPTLVMLFLLSFTLWKIFQ
ncbi:unnamed protein product [Rotaria sp. Silwood2]|nr:unnamed protein product [Rotaria sp. Silwood2]